MSNGTSLVESTLQQLDDRRQRLLNGGVNCIPSPFKRFTSDFCGIEQETYYCITSYTKGGKCFGKGTQVRLSDNSLKNVEDVVIGDEVMSPNGYAPKKVIGTNKGVAPLYRITSEMYDPIVVNGDHIMYLFDCHKKKYITMSMNKLFQIYNTMDWNYFCRKYKMVASSAVHIESDVDNLPVEPYSYGLWLGEGKTDATINTAYMNALIDARYELLAGIIDAGGHLNSSRTGYEICLQYESLVDDIIDLGRSLGFTCKKSKKYDKDYIINISGNECASIPTKVKHIPHSSKVNKRHYAFKIESIGDGEFYGFEVGGDHLFVLKDYTIVHNSQLTSYMFIFKTIIYAYFAKEDLDFKIIYFPLEETKERIMQRFMSWLLFKFSHKSIRISPRDLRSTTSVLDEKILDRLSQKDIQYILKYFEEHIIFPTEAPNPTGIFKFCKQYANEHGKTYTKTVKMKDELGVLQDVEVFDRYEQDNPNEYRMVIIDTINLIDTERGMTLKQSMDKLSEYCAKYLRNRYHYSPIVIQQQAFESEGNDSFKLGRVRPSVYGLGDSKYISRDKQLIYTIL